MDVPLLLVQLVPSLLALGWLIVVFLILLASWETYRLLKMIDYVSMIEWTFLQVTLPADSEETPKSMEVMIDVLGGIHKNPDLIEKYFDGYQDAHFSCELHCTAGRARYIMVVPTAHRAFFEGAIYGQYPKAEIREVEDYTQKYRWQDIRKTFDMYGTEMILVDEDIYPIKSYLEFEASLAEEYKLVDPHQIVIEAFTNLQPGEEYWYQVIIRPKDAKQIREWSKKGEKEVSIISGKEKKEASPSIIARAVHAMAEFPVLMFGALLSGVPPEPKSKDKELTLRFFNPLDEAKMKGITLKTSSNAYKTKIRVIHIAPLGQIKKPNIGRAIGAFKQFAGLNSLKPDPETKSNGPNFIMRERRRLYREKVIFLLFQWRDMFGDDAGQWFTGEELATLYHFPVIHVKSPYVERAKSGLQSPPENLPYI